MLSENGNAEMLSGKRQYGDFVPTLPHLRHIATTICSSLVGRQRASKAP